MWQCCGKACSISTLEISEMNYFITTSHFSWHSDQIQTYGSNPKTARNKQHTLILVPCASQRHWEISGYPRLPNSDSLKGRKGEAGTRACIAHGNRRTTGVIWTKPLHVWLLHTDRSVISSLSVSFEKSKVDNKHKGDKWDRNVVFLPFPRRWLGSLGISWKGPEDNWKGNGRVSSPSLSLTTQCPNRLWICVIYLIRFWSRLSRAEAPTQGG